MAREQAYSQHSDDTSRRQSHASGAAAVGTVDTTSSDDPENELVIVGTTASPTTFEVTVSERIVPGRYADALSLLGTTGRSAEDAVTTGIRSYRFDGAITGLRMQPGALAFLNGESVGATERLD